MSTGTKEWILSEAKQVQDTLCIDLWYPRVDENLIKKIEIGLVDVRGADSIRISYDFERDGWKIEQASIFTWSETDQVCDQDWQEVGFIQAWARKKPDEVRE